MPTVTYNWVTTTSSFFVNDSFTAGVQDSVSITAINGGAGYFSAWDFQDSAVEGRIIGSNGAPAGSEFLVNSTLTNNQNDSSTAQLTGGNIVVTFTDYSIDAGGDVRARLFTSNGTAVDLDFELSTSSLPQFDTDVAALADGGFVVSWTADWSSDTDVRFRVFNSDGTLRSDIGVPESSISNSGSRSQVIGLANGNFVVVWEQEPAAGGDSEVYFQIFDSAGTGVTSAMLIDTIGSINEDIQVVALQDGGFAVAYTDNGWAIDGTEITARIYNGDGSTRTGYIRVNTANTTGNQDQPTLTVLSNGYIVVGWQDAGSLYYQAYDPNGSAIGSNDFTIGAVVEGEIAALSGGLVANVRSSTVADDGGDQSIRSSIDELVRTTTGDATSETLIGDSLRDIMDGMAGNDTLVGFGNNDTLNGGDGNDTLEGNAGDDILDGGAGIDTGYYGSAPGYVRVNLNLAGAQNTVNDGVDTLTSIENLVGSNFNDRFYGNAAANAFYGGGGNDYLNGGDGNDQLRGQAGNDFIWGGFGADNLYGGDGNDRLVGYNENDALFGEAGDDLLYAGNNDDYVNGGVGNDSLFGEAGDDSLYGGDGDEYIDGGVGNDSLYGEAGVDQLRGGAGFDYADGGAGNDVVFGGDGNDTLHGGADNDLIFGEGGVDVLFGDAGSDNLFGGIGSDTLTGGLGADLFRMDSLSGVDTITDFSVADDTIALNRNVFTAFTVNGTLSASAFRQGGGAVDADDRIIYDQSTGFIFYDSDGSGAAPQILIATVTVGAALTNADFLIYG